MTRVIQNPPGPGMSVFVGNTDSVYGNSAGRIEGPTATWDFAPMRFSPQIALLEDIDNARKAFGEDDEGMTWDEFLPDYLDTLCRVRASMAQPKRSLPIESILDALES
jgi:hypothetical protein